MNQDKSPTESMQLHFDLPAGWGSLPRKLNNEYYANRLDDLVHEVSQHINLGPSTAQHIKHLIDSLTPNTAEELATLLYCKAFEDQIKFAVMSITIAPYDLDQFEIHDVQKFIEILAKSKSSDIGTPSIQVETLSDRTAVFVNRWSREIETVQEINEAWVWLPSRKIMLMVTSATSSFDFLSEIESDLKSVALSLVLA